VVLREKRSAGVCRTDRQGLARRHSQAIIIQLHMFILATARLLGQRGGAYPIFVTLGVPPPQYTLFRVTDNHRRCDIRRRVKPPPNARQDTFAFALARGLSVSNAVGAEREMPIN
jgi:hypothetical protein